MPATSFWTAIATPSKPAAGPYVLGEHHVWLRQIAFARLRDPVHFWRRIEKQPPWKGPVPADVRRGLESMLPDRRLPCEIKHRVAGIGSLGHQRVLFVADLSGGRIAREAKALLPSACVWASQQPSGELHYSEIMDRSVRVRDPFVRVQGNWVIRRLAADCSRIELFMLPAERDEERLLYAMGWETANIHLGSRDRHSRVLRDLKKRPARWLHHASKAMVASHAPRLERLPPRLTLGPRPQRLNLALIFAVLRIRSPLS